VLEQCSRDMFNYQGSGMSVMEMSHRSKVFMDIADSAQSLLREVMNIPDNYKVLFMQGGASLQFSAIPINLKKNGKAD
jgi:phosphoserine aminotransferase